MADVERIEVSYNRKVQLDQYEPMQHGATLIVDVESDDDVDAVYDEYRERVESMVEHAIAERLAAKKLSEEDD